MKKIVVGIDFSKCSINALKYSILVANKLEVDILMIWVSKPGREDSVYNDYEDIHKKEAKKRFEEIISKFENKLHKGKLSYTIQSGKVYQEIANQAKYTEASLIVTGTHGVSGFEEFFLGSNAYRIVTYAECPVITIREGFEEDWIKKIVLPIDDTSETRHKVTLAAQIASLFNAEIHLLALYTSDNEKDRKRVYSYAKQVEEYLKDQNIKLVFEKRDSDNIADTTIEYAESVQASLITIMTSQERTPTNLIIGAYAQQIVNHSSIPVLSIEEKTTYNINIKPFNF